MATTGALPSSTPFMLGGDDKAKNEYFEAIQKTLAALQWTAALVLALAECQRQGQRQWQGQLAGCHSPNPGSQMLLSQTPE